MRLSRLWSKSLVQSLPEAKLVIFDINIISQQTRELAAAPVQELKYSGW